MKKGASKEAMLVCRVLKSEEREIVKAAERTNKSKSDWIRENLLALARAGKSAS